MGQRQFQSQRCVNIALKFTPNESHAQQLPSRGGKTYIKERRIARARGRFALRIPRNNIMHSVAK